MQISQNQLFFQMGEISLDGYFIFDIKENSFSYVNNALLSLFSIENEVDKLTPETLLAKVRPEDREHAKSCYFECLEDFTPKKYEFRLLLGEVEKYVRFSVYPFDSDTQSILCGTVEDTTVLKHNKIHIEQINARKNAALEILSHDLKEPMGLMKLTVSAIEKEIALIGNHEISESIQFIKDMCERNIKLVRSIINHELAKSAIVELGKERGDIVLEINDIIRTYRRSHLKDLREFKFSSSHDKIYFEFDSMKLVQVVNNLISNAIKFTPVGGVIEILVEDKSEEVLVVVKDNGIGIPEAHKATLFEMDKETFRTGLNGEESGGLGMSIIKTIIDLHHGKIWFESEQNVGTTFYISLPKTEKDT